VLRLLARVTTITIEMPITIETPVAMAMLKGLCLSKVPQLAELELYYDTLFRCLLYADPNFSYIYVAH
jgi:hypothetical protein